MKTKSLLSGQPTVPIKRPLAVAFKRTRIKYRGTRFFMHQIPKLFLLDELYFVEYKSYSRLEISIGDCVHFEAAYLNESPIFIPPRQLSAWSTP